MAQFGFGKTCGESSAAVASLFEKRTSAGDLERNLQHGLKVVQISEGSPLLPSVIDLIARGECGTTTTAPDPLLDWAYKPRPAEEVYKPLTTPPSEHRQRWFQWIATYSIFFGLDRNGVYALVEQTSNRVVAAAITGPPGTTQFGFLSTAEMEQNMRRADRDGYSEPWSSEMVIGILIQNKRVHALAAWQGHMQEKADLKKHLYVFFFDTLPECQSMGYGSALLRFLNDVADADGVVSFLETAGSRNLAFYAKKGGFVEVDRSPVANFDHEGGGVTMLRRPVARTRGSRGGSSPPRRINANDDDAVETARASAHAFCSKRPTGPLASRCSVCGQHRDCH